LIDKEKKSLAINFNDELVKGTLIAKDGAIVNAMIAERLGGKSGASAAAPAKPANGNGKVDGKRAAPRRQPKGSKTGDAT
jgi:NAD(P) transhydrogenase subunit alpha